jgi:hypothetical protein
MMDEKQVKIELDGILTDIKEVRIIHQGVCAQNRLFREFISSQKLWDEYIEFCRGCYNDRQRQDIKG